MIAKYRNFGIVFAILACGATGLFLYAARQGVGFGLHDNWRGYILPLYVLAGILWSITSYYLAKAKGYHSDALGRVLMISLLLGFCCQPVALVFPFIGFFLDDKTRTRSHRRRRRSSHRPED
jgi:hypothetical protein